MDIRNRIEAALQRALEGALVGDAPPRLAAAVRHAVWPGGARVRPRLCLAVALACGDDDPPLTDAAAAAIELLHCASLVHDDLPCFDNARLRRGRPSVHAAYGERLAVLSGDALIVLALQGLGAVGARMPQRLPAIWSAVTRGVSMPHGIVAGQALECEPQVVLAEYQRAKTGALFVAATVAGAEAAGAAGGPWRALGACLGEAYQVADDIRDVVADPQALGKPVGQDEMHDRPSSTRTHGLVDAARHFGELVDEAVSSIPACPGRPQLQALVRAEGERLVPTALCADLLRQAA